MHSFCGNKLKQFFSLCHQIYQSHPWSPTFYSHIWIWAIVISRSKFWQEVKDALIAEIRITFPVPSKSDQFAIDRCDRIEMSNPTLAAAGQQRYLLFLQNFTRGLITFLVNRFNILSANLKCISHISSKFNKCDRIECSNPAAISQFSHFLQNFTFLSVLWSEVIKTNVLN